MINIQQNHIVDGYKLGHSSQYVPKTDLVYSNMTPRDSRLARVIKESFDNKVTYFGISYACQTMKENWNRTFFNKPKDEVINKYSRRIKQYLGSDHGDYQIECMAKLHDLGYLPIQIKSLPEGSFVNMQIPVFTVKNTHPDFFWLVNYLETFLSCTIWPFCNSASLSRQYYNTSLKYGEITGAGDIWLNIANHCFAGRGHRGQEDAMISGMGHLLFSFGTDTLWAIDGMEEYYNADCEQELIACSVNAFEHATATQRIAYYESKGFSELDAEIESVRDVCNNLYPTGIISYVADSKDYFRFIHQGLKELKDDILKRGEDSLGLCKFVVRPDSSPKTPLEIILGDPESEDPLEKKGSLDILWEIFGGTFNDKGYKVLNPKIGLIYGEAIDIELQEKIYKTMEQQGWCVSNLLLGVGSWGFLDRSSRDSFSFAIKGTHSVVDDESISMQKTPKTAAKSKSSAKGLLRVEEENGNFVLYDQQTGEQETLGCLEVVFEDGKLIKETTLQEIRDRVQSSIMNSLGDNND